MVEIYSEAESQQHSFIETVRHRNEFIIIIIAAVLYAVGNITNNIIPLIISAILAGVEKYLSYNTLLSDVSQGFQVHRFDVISAYLSHFLLFSSITNALLINDPANYDITNPTDRFTDALQYTLTISVTQGYGDVVPKSRIAKILLGIQTVDAVLLTLSFGLFLISAFVGTPKSMVRS